VKTVPVCINTVQHPLPTPARCLKLGQAIGRAIQSYEENLRVLMVGTGGLSHQLDGERAGFINREFDLMCLDKLVTEPGALARYSVAELVELTGSQGIELMMWRRCSRNSASRSPNSSAESALHAAPPPGSSANAPPSGSCKPGTPAPRLTVSFPSPWTGPPRDREDHLQVGSPAH